MIKKKKLDNRNTYTGLEFKEQWSTIISGRKSNLNAAITSLSPSEANDINLLHLSDPQIHTALASWAPQKHKVETGAQGNQQ